jgi:glyoxylase-like metal-dependent hydrolase (beta-lactamase superfamily II)
VVWRVLKAAGAILLLVVAAAAAALVWSHFQVQRERAPLPLVADLLAWDKQDGLPVRVSVIETGRQPMPRSAVLDPSGDPRPSAPYVMTHPSFVVEWADGRLLLIDAGMTKAKAEDFGALIERFAGASPLVPLGTPAAALGDAASRVGAIVFTHLHIDHVDGLRELCPRVGHAIKLFQTPPQQDTWTFTTSEGKRVIAESSCVTPVRVTGKALLPLDGYPGVALIAAGGHTPESQIVAVTTRDAGGTVHRYLFAGDITNAIDGVRSDVSKPFLYRLAIVPEDDDRLGELRRYLRALEQQQGYTIVVSHDQLHLKDTGIPAWGS